MTQRARGVRRCATSGRTRCGSSPAASTSTGRRRSQTVAAHCHGDRGGPRRGAHAIPVRVVAKPVVTDADGIRASSSRPTRPRPASASSPGCTRSRRPRCGSPGSTRSAAAPAPPAHPVPRRDPVGRHRHGLHEPEPGRPRRPRVRVHGRAHAPRAQGRRGPLDATPRSSDRVGAWTRAAARERDWETGRIARFGDNMRDVAVTEGDKVEAQRRLGFSVDTFGVGDLVAVIAETSDAEVDALIATYLDEYDVAPGPPPRWRSAPSRCATGRGSSSACAASSTPAGSSPSPTTFEDLHGLTQLPGLAVQRLMRDGYGFGAEGDWKTAAMVRAMKVMSQRPAGRRLVHGGLHLPPDRRRGPQPRGAHARGLRVDRRALGRGSRSTRSSIGGKADPVRLVFDAHPGQAVAASIVDMGTALPDGRDRSST